MGLVVILLVVSAAPASAEGQSYGPTLFYLQSPYRACGEGEIDQHDYNTVRGDITTWVAQDPNFCLYGSGHGIQAWVAHGLAHYVYLGSTPLLCDARTHSPSYSNAIYTATYCDALAYTNLRVGVHEWWLAGTHVITPIPLTLWWVPT